MDPAEQQRRIAAARQRDRRRALRPNADDPREAAAYAAAAEFAANAAEAAAAAGGGEQVARAQALRQEAQAAVQHAAHRAQVAAAAAAAPSQPPAATGKGRRRLRGGMLRMGQQDGKYVIIAPGGEIVASYRTQATAIAHLNSVLRQQRAAAEEAEARRRAEEAARQQAAALARQRAAELARQKAADEAEFDFAGEMGLPPDDDDEMEGTGRYHGGFYGVSAGDFFNPFKSDDQLKQQANAYAAAQPKTTYAPVDWMGLAQLAARALNPGLKGGDADMDAAFDDIQSKVAPVYDVMDEVVPGLGTIAQTVGNVFGKPFASWVADPTGEDARTNAAIAAKKAAADAQAARDQAADQAASAAVAAGDSYADLRNRVGLPANASIADTAHAANRMMGFGRFQPSAYFDDLS